MTLRKQPKPKRKTGRLRCPSHLAFVRKFKCLISNDFCDGPVEAAHWRLGSHSGLSQKPDDTMAIPLCQRHHRISHNQGEATFKCSYNLDIEAAISELCRKSPALKRMKMKDKP